MTKQQQQTYVLIAMLIGGGGYFYWTKFYKPLVEKITAQKADLEKKIKDLNEAKEKKSQLKKLQEDAKKFEDRLGVTYQRLPFKEEMSALISALNRAEKTSRITQPIILPQSQIDRGTHIEVPYKVIVEGDYAGLGSFINFLHSRERLIAVTDVQLSAGQSPAPGRSIKADIMFSAFRSKENMPDWFKKTLIPTTFKPEVEFKGGYKDPFIPMTPQELTELGSGVNFDRLELKGFTKFSSGYIAQFQDTFNQAKFSLKKDGKFYQTTADGDQLMKSVKGRVEIDRQRVLLWSRGKSGAITSQKAYPIPNIYGK